MSRLENPLQLDGHAQWLAQARQFGGQHWVANARCTVCCSDAGTPAIPVTRLSALRPEDSYVASPRAAWLHYPRREAARHGHTSRWLASAAGGPLGGLISAARLDSAWHVNNWLIATNLHPQWSDNELTLLTDTLLARQPDAPLLLRNVCEAANPGLPALLQAQGWQLLPARQVYLCQPGDAAVWQLPNVRQDQKLLDGSGLTVLGPAQLREADLPALQQCYRLLFLEKHSPLNPDFTLAFFRLCLQHRFVDLYALTHEGRIVGCREEELIAAEAPWIDSHFKVHQKGRATRSRTIRGELRVPPSSRGEVLDLEQTGAQGVFYPTHFDCLPGRPLLVPEHALEEWEKHGK